MTDDMIITLFYMIIITIFNILIANNNKCANDYDSERRFIFVSLALARKVASTINSRSTFVEHGHSYIVHMPISKITNRISLLST